MALHPPFFIHAVICCFSFTNLKIVKVYIKKTEENSLFEQAKVGFIKMGFETIYYDVLTSKVEEYAIVVGFINDILNISKIMGFDELKQIDYPTELKQYLHREIITTNTFNLPEKYPFFIKPTNMKSFSGRVVKEFKDLIGVLDTQLYFTETIHDIISEWRCFILNGEILGVKHYKGNPFVAVDENILNEMVSKFTTSPNAYSLDIGVTKEGLNILVECNNGYSTGNYGLTEIQYAKFLMQGYLDIAKRSLK